MAQGKRVHVIGGVTEIVRTFDEFERLENRLISDHADLYGFKNLTEYSGFCSDFPDLAGTTGSLFRLWCDFREKGIKSLLSSCHPVEKDAELTISTVHRAKGLEWQSVRLAKDFIPKSKKVWITESTRRLNYVAVTRAKEVLSMPPDLLDHVSF